MKKNLLIFGGGDNQLTLIRAAKDCGYFTVVVDPVENAPAKEIADAFEVVGAKDYDKTREVAIKYAINGIVTSQMENPLLLMSKLAEELGYIFPKPNHILQARNKFLMKQCFIKAGVDCAKGILLSKNTELSALLLKDFTYPLIIKPLDSFSSRGVYKVNSFDEINLFINNTKSFSSNGDVLIEEFMEGSEVSVESITYNGVTSVFQITDKIITTYPCAVEMGHIQPSGLDTKTQIAIQTIVKAAIKSLSLDNCASHAEVKITPTGVKMVEIGARLGGDYISSYLTSMSTGISLEAAAAKVAMGDTPDVNPICSVGAVIKYLELAPNSKVKKIGNWLDVLHLPSVVHSSLFVKEGDLVHPITDSAKRAGFVICRGKTREEAIANADIALTQLKSYCELE